MMSEQQARGQHKELLATWRFSTRLTSLVTIPAAGGLMVVALPVAAVFYFHGEFTYQDVTAMAWTTIGFAPGLMAQGAVRTTVQVYYAVGDTRTPVIASACSVVAVLTLGLLLLPYEVLGLAIALSVASFLQLALLLLLLPAKLRAKEVHAALGMRELLRSFLVQGAMATAAVCAAWGVCLLGDWPAGFTATNLLVLFGAIALAIAIYGGFVLVLKLEEAKPVLDKVSRIFSRLSRKA